jgi:hypothetical protein
MSEPTPQASRARAALGGRSSRSSSAELPPRGALGALGVSLGVALLLPHLPYVRWLAWPLMLLSTLAHELGHGVAALLVGGSFRELSMWWDGSGVATTATAGGRLSRAVVSAGGLVGPAFVAAGLFVVGRRERLARISLGLLAVTLLAALVLVVRGSFAIGFATLLVLGLGALARYAAPWLARFTLVLLAVQLTVCVFTRADYLFTPEAHTAAGVMPSDVAQIADALLLPYWFWGGLCALVSLGVLVLGLWSYLRPQRRSAARPSAPRPATLA